MGLPQGYDSLLGDNGVRLSNEEALRIALARALVRQPDLLLLDDATAALDTQAEQRFLETIDSLGRELGILLATNRLALAVRAENIAVLSQGRVVQHGPHHVLVTADGEYRRMWVKQNGFVSSNEDGYLGERFYIIVHGTVEVSREGGGRIAVLEDGDYFGELALLRDAPRAATIHTLTPCEMLTLTREQFSHLLMRNPSVRDTLDRVGAERMQPGDLPLS